MTRNEAIENLKNSTVKIDSSCGVGSGFFIGKNLIATCYHVIEGCSKKELTVIWNKQKYKVKSIESNLADDLAILEVNIKNHPVISLNEKQNLNLEDKCYSFGFPTNHRETGDPLSFEYEGSNDKFLKFKNGQFESGFSGSPILNLQTLKVFGIINKTRDEQSSLGGRGISILKLISFLKSKGYEIDDNGSIFSKNMFKNWVWTSSVESADKLQFSVLALVETLIAVGISFYIWIYYGFYWHIITGLIIAPLFFLKNEESERNAIAFFFKLMKKYSITKRTNLQHLFLNFIKIPISLYILFIWLAIKIYFTNLDFGEFIGLYYFYFHPTIIFNDYLYLIYFIFLLLIMGDIAIPTIFLFSYISRIIITIQSFSFKSIKRIPLNWFKINLATDLTYPLEILPGITKNTTKLSKYNKLNLEYFYNPLPLISIKYLKKNMYKKSKPKQTTNTILKLYYKMIAIIINFVKSIGNIIKVIFYPIFYFSIFIFIIMPMILFKYSLKSTAWIYLPLIWLIQPQNDSDLTERMKEETFTPKAYLMFIYSIIVVFVFTLFPLIFPHTEIYFQNLAIPDTLKKIFFAYEFNIWHLTRFLSALITILFVVSFGKILIRRESEPTYGNFWGAKILSLRYVRSILTLITLGFTAYQILELLPDGFFMGLWEKMRFTI